MKIDMRMGKDICIGVGMYVCEKKILKKKKKQREVKTKETQKPRNPRIDVDYFENVKI